MKFKFYVTEKSINVYNINEKFKFCKIIEKLSVLKFSIFYIEFKFHSSIWMTF